MDLQKMEQILQEPYEWQITRVKSCVFFSIFIFHIDLSNSGGETGPGSNLRGPGKTY